MSSTIKGATNKVGINNDAVNVPLLDNSAAKNPGSWDPGSQLN